MDLWYLGDGTIRIVGVPGMAALPRASANGLNVSLNTCVKTVRACGDLIFFARLYLLNLIGCVDTS